MQLLEEEIAYNSPPRTYDVLCRWERLLSFSSYLENHHFFIAYRIWFKDLLTALEPLLYTIIGISSGPIVLWTSNFSQIFSIFLLTKSRSGNNSSSGGKLFDTKLENILKIEAKSFEREH